LGHTAPFHSSVELLKAFLAVTPSGFVEILGDYFPVFHLELCSRYCLLSKTSPNDSEQHNGNDSNHSQEGSLESKLT
jgi:hypothetical protein